MNTVVGNTIGAAVPQGYYTVTQLATYAGLSSRTIRRWQQAGKLVPSRYMQCGQLRIALYDRSSAQIVRRNNKRRK